MLREAPPANRVDHAHIIDITTIGETDDGELYLVMEYLVGTPLSTDLAHGPMPLNRGRRHLEQMAQRSLARTISASCIATEERQHPADAPRRSKDSEILDFGLAALAHDQLGAQGAVFGPRIHVAEQALGSRPAAFGSVRAPASCFSNADRATCRSAPEKSGQLPRVASAAAPAPARPAFAKTVTRGGRIVLRLLE